MLANDIRNYQISDDYLAHHGIIGQKWGVRRFQDKSGRLTAEGKKRRSEYYDNGLKKPKGKLVIHEKVRSGFDKTLTDAGKQFKKDVENHVVDFYASMPEERLKKIRDTYSEYKSLDAKWRGGDKPLNDKELKRLNDLEKEWDDMSYNLTKECMGKTFKRSNPEWDKDAYDIAWSAYYDTSKDIYEGTDPKSMKSEKEDKKTPSISPLIAPLIAPSIAPSNNQRFQDVVRQFQDQVDNFQNQTHLNSIQQNLINNSMMYTPMYFGKKDKNLSNSDLVDEVYSAIWGEDYISHHGILGQKWGKKNGPPYPLTAGSHSSSEKKAASAAGVKVGKSSGRGSSEGLNIIQSGQKEKPGLIGSMIEGAKDAKLNKQRKAALEKARQAKAAKAEYEAEKKKALESGDYKQIQKYANELSTKELQDALMRADTLDRLNKSVDAHTPKQKDVWDTIDDVANKVGTATNAFNKGKDAWNSFANAWNTFADDDSMLPELGTNFAEQKEKKRKEAAEAVRKAQVEEITKTVDPSKVMKNQSLFTDAELRSAKERIGNYEALKLQNQLSTDGAEKAVKEAEARAKEQLEKNRKDKIADLTKKGDISEILKNKDLFTNDELESASARYEILKNIERKINDVSPKDLERKINDVSPKDLEDIYEYLDDWND